ncbi:MAG: hypothetical protein EAZ58_11910, partial [Flavobacterium sp.]
MVGYFSLRNYALQKVLQKAKAKVESRANVTIAVGKAKFVGISTIEVCQIAILPINKDTLFRTDTVRVSVKLLPLLFGRIRLSNMDISNTLLYLRKDSLQTNYRGLLKPTQKKEKKQKTEDDISKTTFENVKTLLKYLPDEVEVRNARLSLKYNDSLRYITLQTLSWNNTKYTAIIEPQKEFATQNWIAEGYFDKYNVKGSFDLYGPQKVDMYFASLFGSQLSFNKLHLQIDKLDYRNKTLQFDAGGSLEDLQLYNNRIAADTVSIAKTGGNLALRINRNFVIVDSSSVFTVNNIQFSAFAQYPVGADKKYALSLTMPSTPAQTFFTSLPAGMFNKFEGIQTKGNLSYHLNCFMDGAMPDSLQFTSELKKENFEIVKYGKENFARINGTFSHTVYEGGNPIRNFLVGAENPNFVA